MTREEFTAVIDRRHQYAQEWKAKTGRKVVGYFCTYMPEEIAYAAGLLTVRVISGTEPPALVERYMPSWTCPFSRGCLNEAIAGRYDYLDGLVFPFTCFHMHSAFHYWAKEIPIAYSYRMTVPKVLERSGVKAFFVEELRRFKRSLEGLTDRRISDDDLRNGIAILNRSRQLMRQVYELRKADSPPLSGAEAHEMVLSSQVMDKEEHSALVAGWLEVLPTRQDRPPSGPRLMVVGSAVDRTEVIRDIEDQGATVVTDDLCVGSRYFCNDTRLDGDPLLAIADRYLERRNCPTKAAWDRRYRDILQLARDYRVDGVLVLHQKFCMPHETDYPRLKQLLQEAGLPHLLLELDIPVPHGQIRSRAQAFVEMLQPSLV